ncbi:DUF4760 domain-containing protein, partial [Pseudomonas aeruginosa]
GVGLAREILCKGLEMVSTKNRWTPCREQEGSGRCVGQTLTYRRLQALHNADDSNMRAYAREDRRESEEANEIRYVLNHWERICVGINQGIYCEKMLREANYSTVMKLYEQAEPFIRAIREIEKKKTFYQELEKLHSKWVKKPLAEKK